MAYEVIWAPSARLDLKELASYIAESRPIVAARFVKQVFHIVEHLADFPESGRVVPEFDDPNCGDLFSRTARQTRTRWWSGGDEVDVLGGAEAAFGEGEVVDPGGVVAEEFAAGGVYGDRVERGEDQAEVFLAAGEVAALKGYGGIHDRQGRLFVEAHVHDGVVHGG